MRLFASIACLSLLLAVFAAAPPPILHTVLTTNTVDNSPGLLVNDGTTLNWTNGLTLSGGNVYITNILYATTIITTNITVYQTLVVSNIVAGNIQGTPNTIAMIGPDPFSVENSGITQDDTNTWVFHGDTNLSATITLPKGTTGNPEIEFGTEGTLAQSGGSQRLVWNSTGSNPYFVVKDLGGNEVQLGVGSGIGFVSSASVLELFAAAKGLILDSINSAVYPIGGGVGETLGSGTNYFGGLWLGTNGLFGVYSDDGTQLLRGGVPANRKFLSTSSTPNAATVGAGNTILWSSNGVFYATTSTDGVSASTKLLAP